MKAKRTLDISPARLGQFLHVYQYSRDDFAEYMAGKPIPILSVKADCIQLLDRIDEAKLRAVHAVLTGLVS